MASFLSTAKSLFKYITPLRITVVWMSVLAIRNFINTEQLTEQGYEPGLGGLGYLVFGGLALFAFALDLILSLTLSQKLNWLVQTILVLIFAVALSLS